MSKINLQLEMLTSVANALGQNLLDKVVFVGGCTVGLLVTDAFTKEQVRYTDDVDMIVDVTGYTEYSNLQQQLRRRGFSDPPPDEQGVICRMFLKELKVDFMPIDDDALGFGNRWYSEAVKTAEPYQLDDETTINLIRPEYLIATKLEAFAGRGNGDLLYSRDIEDILNIFDGRAAIVNELRNASEEMRGYIRAQLTALLEDSDFEYAVQSTSQGNPAREELIFERIESSIQDE